MGYVKMTANSASSSFIGQIKEFSRYGDVKEEIKLDLVDRKILYLLSQNSRLSYTFLAKTLKVKRETVAYRIKKMKESDFLHGHLALLNHRKLGFRNYIVYFKLRALTNEKEMLDYLLSFNEVTRLKNCSGSYDIQLVASVKKEEELLDLLEKVVSRYHSSIHSYDLLEALEEDFMGINLLLNKEEITRIKTLEHKGSTFQRELEKASLHQEEISLDNKDKQILEELKLNADISIQELSLKIKLAPIAVENRIRKLIRSGIIKRFLPLASLNQLGYQWWKAFFKFKNLDRQKFLTFLRCHPHILWYTKLLGKWDYQFSIFAKDNAEFHRIFDEIRAEFADNILSYDSIIIFNQFRFVQRVE